MPQKTRPQIKTLFETGKIPSEDDFVDLIDSAINIVDDAGTPGGVALLDGESKIAGENLSQSAIKSVLGAASSGQDGYLSSSDWSAFNSKEQSITPGAINQYYRGDKTFQAIDTSVVVESAGYRYVTDADLITLGNTAGVNSGDETQSSIKTKLGQATSLQDGYLSASDWNSFNSKEPGIASGSASQYYRGDKTFQTLDTSAVPDYPNLRYVTDSDLITLGQTSGINTGDETNSTIKSKLGQASAIQDGYLSLADWATFNSKEPSIAAGTTAQYYRGDKTFQTLDTSAVPDTTNARYVTDANLITIGNTSGINTGDETQISIKTKLGPATSLQDGYLLLSDWSTFNSKEPAVSAGTESQYYRGDKTFQELNYSAVSGLGSIATQNSNNVSITGGLISGTGINSIDNTFTIENSSDSSKKAKFDLSGISASNTRTYTLPNVSAPLVALNGISQRLELYTVTASGDLYTMFVGRGTGNLSSFGTDNIIFGPGSSPIISGGSRNFILGSRAAVGLTFGDDNIAVGWSSASNLSTGSRNTYVGTGIATVNGGVVGDNNTFSGYWSGRFITSCYNNSAYGTQAAYTLTSGHSNCIFGYLSGSLLTNHVGNVFMGNQAGSLFPVNNKLIIANSNTTSPLIYGDFETDSLGVGGNITPTARLHLAAGSVIVNGAPFKFTSGSLMATPEAGAMEYNGSDLYFSVSGPTRKRVALSPDSTPANGSLLIGNGLDFSLSTISSTTNQTTVTNGGGTISIGTVQDIGITSAPNFNSVTLGDNTTNGTMLTFNSERTWSFVANSSGSTTDLTLKPNTDSKYFRIRSQNGANIVFQAYVRNTATGNEISFVQDGGVVGIGLQSPHSSAKLEVSSTTQGFLPPQVTTAEKNAISSPAAGLIVYDTDLLKLAVHNGTSWETVTSS